MSYHGEIEMEMGMDKYTLNQKDIVDNNILLMTDHQAMIGEWGEQKHLDLSEAVAHPMWQERVRQRVLNFKWKLSKTDHCRQTIVGYQESVSRKSGENALADSEWNVL